MESQPNTRRVGPTVQVVAADFNRAAKVVNILSPLPLHPVVRVDGASPDTSSDATLVVLEGLEAAIDRENLHHNQLVTFNPDSPITFGERPVLPAYAPGALQSWGTLLCALHVQPSEASEYVSESMAHTDRLAAVGTLAAGFAHEVNNPAQSVTFDLAELTEQLRVLESGVDEMVQMGLNGDMRERLHRLHLTFADARNLVQECFDGLGRITGIVRDLRSFSRIQTDRIDRVHPNEVVNQACAIANNHIRHRAQLVKELEADAVFPGDRNKLVQIVTNLLVNAAQALPENSEDAQILVKSYADQERVVLSVVDSGPGIPEDVLTQIFDPFFTTKVGDGTGLGLALSLDIARQHGGTLEVHTEVGVGTQFDLIIPLENGLDIPKKEPADPVFDVVQSGRVLVVDDEPGILRSLGRLIRRRHEVQTLPSGREALELLKEDQNFDVILCDLMMPDVDGPMLYDLLCQHAPSLTSRMVFMSGGAFTERAQSFLEQVKPRLLDKPAPAAILEQTIQKVMTVPAETSELPGPNELGPPTRSFT